MSERGVLRLIFPLPRLGPFRFTGGLRVVEIREPRLGMPALPAVFHHLLMLL